MPIIWREFRPIGGGLQRFGSGALSTPPATKRVSRARRRALPPLYLLQTTTKDSPPRKSTMIRTSKS
jgi:hypothetical protein